MSYFLVFLGFALLILLHEGGHFVAAKAVGMRVERFSLFFGPMLWKRKVGETEYGIGVIPLGGYVKITGMSPAEVFEEPSIEARAYVNQPPWKRIVVIAAGPAVNIFVAFLLVLDRLHGLGTRTRTSASTPGRAFHRDQHPRARSQRARRLRRRRSVSGTASSRSTAAPDPAGDSVATYRRSRVAAPVGAPGERMRGCEHGHRGLPSGRRAEDGEDPSALERQGRRRC